MLSFAKSPSGAHDWGLSFGYDVWANLLSATVTKGDDVPMLSQSVDTNNRISGYCYDAAGNLLAQSAPPCPVPTYTYDAENRMTATAGVTYTYDGNGKRVKKSNGKLFWYGLNGDALLETDAAGNNPTELVAFNGRRISRRDANGAIYHFLSDHLGSSRIVTNATGTIVEDSDFYPFGGERVIVDSLNNQYKFTGKERDTESGLDYFGARYFSGHQGRFTTTDPLLTTMRAGSPQTLNRYAYTLNNPLRYVDPTGMYEEDVHRGLTTVLALAVGFDLDKAAAIGNATQAMDSGKTNPWAGVGARRDYHFTTPERRDTMWATFQSSGEIGDLGAFLHALEDSYSHAGFGVLIGHFPWRGPDKTHNDPGKANTMAKDVYGRLAAAATRLGVKPGNKVGWEKIDKLVGDFNKAKTREEKNKILDEIKKVISNEQREEQNRKIDEQSKLPACMTCVAPPSFVSPK